MGVDRSFSLNAAFCHHKQRGSKAHHPPSFGDDVSGLLRQKSIAPSIRALGLRLLAYLSLAHMTATTSTNLTRRDVVSSSSYFFSITVFFFFCLTLSLPCLLSYANFILIL